MNFAEEARSQHARIQILGRSFQWSSDTAPNLVTVERVVAHQIVAASFPPNSYTLTRNAAIWSKVDALPEGTNRLHGGNSCDSILRCLVVAKNGFQTAMCDSHEPRPSPSFCKLL